MSDTNRPDGAVNEEPAKHDAHAHGHDEPMPEGEEQAPPGTRTMAVIRWALVIAMGALAIGTWNMWIGPRLASAKTQEAGDRYHCPMHPTIVQDHPGECPICGMDLVVIDGAAGGHDAHAGHDHAAHAKHEAPAAADGATMYECPMHCVPPSDKPGECSKCGMDLVPVKKGEAAQGAKYECPMHCVPPSDAPGECPKCGMDLVPVKNGAAVKQGDRDVKPLKPAKKAGAADRWHCPMHPTIVQDRPGECPICGMDLTPIDESAMEGGGASDVPGLVPVTLSDERIQLIGMKTAKATRSTLSSELRAVGFVGTAENRLASVTTRFAGYIEDLKVAETGRRVQKGQVLATIYSPELLAVQKEFLQSRQWADGGQENLFGDDARRRLELLGVAPQEIAELERTQKPLLSMPLRAPVSGHVTVRGAVRGLYVQPGTSLFEVADLSTVWILADVYESAISRVKEGQKATVTLTAHPGRTFKGRIGFIYPSLDTQTRTLRVRVELANPGLLLKPGMFADVRLGLDSQEGIMVPSEAVADTGDSQYVFIAAGNGRFVPRAVKVGMRAGEHVQLLDGVVEGEEVVTTAGFLVDSESRLRAALSGFGAGSGGDAVDAGSTNDSPAPAGGHQH